MAYIRTESLYKHDEEGDLSWLLGSCSNNEIMMYTYPKELSFTDYFIYQLIF